MVVGHWVHCFARDEIFKHEIIRSARPRRGTEWLTHGLQIIRKTITAEDLQSPAEVLFIVIRMCL